MSLAREFTERFIPDVLAGDCWWENSARDWSAVNENESFVFS